MAISPAAIKFNRHGEDFCLEQKNRYYRRDRDSENSVKPKTSASLINFHARISMKFHSELLKLRFGPFDGDLDRGLFFNKHRAAGVHHGGKKYKQKYNTP